MKISKQDKMYIEIQRHGENLNKIFHTGIEPIFLCKKLHRLELEYNRLAVDFCNGVFDCDTWENHQTKAEIAVDKLLGYRSKNIPVFINGDPRGYTLKIREDYIRGKNIDLHRDFGGYGILAPDFS